MLSPSHHSKTSFSSTLILIVFIFIGCSYIEDSKSLENKEQIVEKNLPFSNFCHFDIDELKNFTKQVLETQLTCIKKNFINFSRYIKTSEHNKITRDDISLLLTRFSPVNKKKMLGSIELLFKINMLLLYEGKESISLKNLDILFELITSSNKQSVIINQILYRIIVNENKEKFWDLRKELKESLSLFAETISRMSSITKKKSQTSPEIDLPQLLNTLISQLEIDDFKNISIEEIVSIKKLLLGGGDEHLTSKEFFDLIFKIPKIIMLIFDFYFIDENLFEDKDSYITFIQKRMESIETLFYGEGAHNFLFTHDHLIKIISLFTDNPDHLSKIEKIIYSIKKNIIKGKLSSYTYREWQDLFQLLKILMKTFYVSHSIEISSSEDIKKNLISYSQYLQATIQKMKPQRMDLEQFSIELFDILALEKDLLPPVLEVLSILGRRTYNSAWTIEELNILLKKIPSMADLLKSFQGLKSYARLSKREQIERHIEILDQIDQFLYVPGKKEYKYKISISHLNLFITKISQDFSTLFQNVIETILQLKDPRYLTQTQIKKLFVHFYFYQKINLYQMNHDQIIQDLTEDNFEEIKIKFIKNTKTLADYIITRLNTEDYIGEKIHYSKFLQEPILIQDPVKSLMIERLIKLKPLVLGGEAEYLTKPEIMNFLSNSTRLAELYFNAILKPSVKKNKDLFSFSQEMIHSLKSIKEILYSPNSSKILLSDREALDIFNYFFPQYSEQIEQSLPFFQRFKGKLLRGKKDEYSHKNIYDIIDMLHLFFEQIYFQHIAYKQNKERLELPEKIIAPLPFKESRETSLYLRAKQIPIFLEKFNHIAQNYHFFKESFDGNQYYSPEVVRSVYGFTELGILQSISEILLKTFGKLDPNGSERNILTLTQLNEVLIFFQPVLVHYNLWTNLLANFANNTLLLGDLFQDQSNGDSQLDVHELSVYGSLILTSLRLSKKIFTIISTMDGCASSTEKVSLKCFEKNFFDIFFNTLKQKKYIPRLHLYLRDNPPSVQSKLLKSIMSFTHDPFRMDDLIQQREIFLFIGALLSIESTFLRYNTSNDDYIIDRFELLKAFPTYRNYFILKKPSYSEKEHINLFFYMTERMKEPNFFSYFNYAYWTDHSDLKVYRINISELLSYLFSQGKTKK